MKKVLALLLALACALPLGVAAAAATGDAIPYPNIGLVVESDLCDGDGAVYSAADVIAPDTTVYFPIEEAAVSKLTDKDFFKVKTDKGDDNSKMIQKVSVTEKNFGTGGRIKGRWVAVKIELKQDITDNEYKLTPEVTFTAKEKVTIGGQEYAEGQKFSIKFKFFMGNTTENADQDYMAGDGGVVLEPNKNEDNEITWEDENRTLARLAFESDDDAKKLFPQDDHQVGRPGLRRLLCRPGRFLFDFIGAPRISSTSRATFEIYNPYYDSDEDALTVDPSDVVIYQVIDGELVDVTPAFSAVETDDGTMSSVQTRQLGTYVVAEMPDRGGGARRAPRRKARQGVTCQARADRKGDSAFLREKITAPHFVPVRSGGRKRGKAAALRAAAFPFSAASG